jgi:DNA-binding transcriptional regulator YhcF (GntR family)
VTGPQRVRITDDGPPPFAQLRDGIRRQVRTGVLLPGDRLSTVRACATELGLAPNTVARAYRELEDEGWIIGRGRAGTFVADRLPERLSGREAALAEAADVYRLRAAQLGFSTAEAARVLDRRR